MKTLSRIVLICLIFFLLLPSANFSQSLPVGFAGLEDYYRRAQLLGEIDSTFSFTARPFFPRKALSLPDTFDPDGSLVENRLTNGKGSITFMKGKGFLQVLPLNIQVAYKRPAPISMNDGAMIPAKGFQTLYSGGLYTEIGPLSIRFQPELLWAQNKEFNGFPQTHSNSSWQAYYNTYNYIDQPERFGEKPYQKTLWGQSSIRLNFGPVSFGLSNENLWWGPGYRNSLLMTNSAPGFRHLVFNTVKPIITPIGNFEGQIVGGKLESSGFTPPILERDNLGASYYFPKPDDWRYFNGMVLTYMPKWIPGLFFGFTRSYLKYGSNLKGLTGYIPLLLPLLEKGRPEVANDYADQYISIFGRWLFLKDHAEIYFEYGREDRSADLRDLYLDPSHSRAYIIGLRKLFTLKNKHSQHIEVILEATQLESLLTRRWKNYSSYVQSWYKHGQIRHGYTNVGQLLGAGIGPGSNLQTFNINWVSGIKKIGIQIERYVHNNDFRYNANLDTRFHWVDFISSAIGVWDFKNFIFTAQIDGIKTHNYQWNYNPTSNMLNYINGAIDDYWAHGKDVYTLQALIGVTYRF